jgi:UDP-GlcNAc:undecaprenyl-phosphate GlcNAc-1-phosphate transferase
MTVYLTLVIAGTAFGAVLTPLVSTASTALGLVDAPGGRKVHSVSVPRLGGLAIACAAALSLAAVAQLAPRLGGGAIADLRSILPILVGGALVLAIGLLDDLTGLPPWPKLFVQIAAAMIVMQSDLRVERITVAGQTWQLGLWSWPVTLVWIVGVTNAFNLIDGVDGLAAGVSVIVGATCAAILVARGHVAEAMLLAALVGAALGFLVYNFSPASIFLGDGGSLLFGFVLATTAITGWQKGATALAAGVPLLIFALPIADAASTLFRRVLRRDQNHRSSISAALARIFEPDRHHIHHRLLALGLSPRRTVGVLYALTLLLSALALATARLN